MNEEYKEKEDPKILIGTSGYSYDDWIGPVYPPGTKKDGMLDFYANELKFNVVELNYTYYTQPAARGTEGMLAKVPDGFRFVVKAHSSMTHKIRDSHGDYIRDESSVDTFLEGMAPMIERESLICVLAQFPMKFKRSKMAMDHLKWLAEALHPVKLTVELRHGGWVAQSVFDFLKGIGASYCVVDEPKLSGLVPFTPVATSDLAYFRFHGRSDKWFDAVVNDRYNYQYSDSQLQEFIEPVNKVSGLATETVMFFNNHFQGQAVTNASRMRELLGV